MSLLLCAASRARFGRRATAGAVILLCALASPAGAGALQPNVEALLEDLRSPDAGRRRSAARRIGEQQIQSATPELVRAASDEDAGVRSAVVTALWQVRDPRAIAGFVALAGDPEVDIRDRAIDGMTQAYLFTETGLAVTLDKVGSYFNPYADEWADVVAEPEYVPAPEVITALQERLADTEEPLRGKAARSLGVLRGRAAIPTLVRVLADDRSNAVRFEAARALGKIADPSAGPALMEMLAYTDARVRYAVIDAIGNTRYAPAVPELTRLYARESAVPRRAMDPFLRQHLLGALALIADPSSTALLLEERGSKDNVLARRAYEGLARIADPSLAAEIEMAHARERSTAIRTAQAWALYRMGRKEFLAQVVDALGMYRASRAARQYLFELRPSELPDLLPHATQGNRDVREGIAAVLGRVGDVRAIPALTELARDKDPQVSVLATEALQRVRVRTRTTS